MNIFRAGAEVARLQGAITRHRYPYQQRGS
jgi:hypothetical protein